MKTTEKGAPRGYDGGAKQITGRKRHIIVDTLGLILAAVVHAASIQDRDGGKMIFERLREEGWFPRLRLVWADGAYAGKLVERVWGGFGWALQIVRCPEG